MEIDKDTILRAWSDEEYRASLAPEVRRAIPDPPPQENSGELTDDQLKAASEGDAAAADG